MRGDAWEWIGTDSGMRVILALAALASVFTGFALGQ